MTRKIIAALLLLMLLPAALAEGTLVAYFSRTGENYSVGVIEKGNTAIVAEIIAEETGADLFEIVPVEAYPDDYDAMLDVARDELNQNARPAIAAAVERFDDYDTIYLGYPIWHGELPRIILTFLESYDFSGKTVIPFNTHEGSGHSGTWQDIADALPEAEVKDGLAVQGRTAQQDEAGVREKVKSWIGGN